ncbi:caspase-8 isoform X2 [Nematostella vectensis]|uniref:caspase-8 isoform X2 n=1 Tax=Nematostella vectensis TaxID=45351 RepID=UPI00207712BB|nr:caspase-8 isoform X2 [Nematostella vectensis]
MANTKPKSLSQDTMRMSTVLSTRLIGLDSRFPLMFHDNQKSVVRAPDVQWPPHGSVITEHSLNRCFPAGFAIQIDYIEGLTHGALCIGVIWPNETLWSDEKRVFKINCGYGCKTLNQCYGTFPKEILPGDSFGVLRSTEGNLHFLLNGQDQGKACSNVPVDVYGYFDINFRNGLQDIHLSLVPIDIFQISQFKENNKKLQLPFPCKYLRLCIGDKNKPKDVNHSTPIATQPIRTVRSREYASTPTTRQSVPSSLKPSSQTISNGSLQRGSGAKKEKEIFPRYSMTKTSRGICLIINNMNYIGNRRNGANNDVNALRRLFKDLHFCVIIKTDLASRDLRETFQEYAMMDHSNFDAFACVIMSHGGEGDVLNCMDGRDVRLEDLMTEFKSLHCATLAGKPKMFFVQACRGSDKENLENISHPTPSFDSIPGEVLERDSSLPRSLNPVEADVLLAYATPPGYVAYRSPTDGSFFIRALVETMREYHQKYHLLEILTLVNRVVGELVNKVDGSIAQISVTTHTLRSSLYL